MGKTSILIVAAAMAVASLPGNAKEKCKVRVSLADTTTNEIVITRSGEDPAKSPYRMKAGAAPMECEIETDEIEEFKIYDWGEIQEKGSTTRVSNFFVENGAVIDARVSGSAIDLTSTGKEFNKWTDVKKIAQEKFGDRAQEIENLPDSLRQQAWNDMMKDYRKWQLEYYATHPMLGFLIELNNRLKSFLIIDSSVKEMLEIYHDKGYDRIYPSHSVHASIAKGEKAGYQMMGGKYNAYDALTLDGDTVSSTDYVRPGRLTLVICWATWCRPCRKEAMDIIPLYNRYHEKGLDALGLAREFKTADDAKNVVETDKHPWPTLIDLDDRFGIFPKHGVASTGLFLVGDDGKILVSSYSIDDIKKELEKRL